MKHRITKHPQLEGTHNDHQGQLLALHRTTQTRTLCLWVVSKLSSSSGPCPPPSGEEPFPNPHLTQLHPVLCWLRFNLLSSRTPRFPYVGLLSCLLSPSLYIYSELSHPRCQFGTCTCSTSCSWWLPTFVKVFLQGLNPWGDNSSCSLVLTSNLAHSRVLHSDRSSLSFTDLALSPVEGSVI